MYELPRSNPKNVRLSIIGITNDLQFRDNLDADVRSSLGEDEISFDPYNAVQLYDILARRAVGALRDTTFRNDISDHEHLESAVLSDDAIPLCSAIAAQDTGDAREAIRLLFRAARFADDGSEQIITEDHIRQAQDWLERKAIENGIKTLPTQKKLALLAVTRFATQDSTPAKTTIIYEQYEQYCKKENADMLSNRRFRDRLNDLADSNILTKVTGRGRGVENQYSLAVDLKTISNNLPSENERLGDTAKLLKKRID